MIACTRLGQRYLWVDRLCIVQDDPNDKASQIAAMDRIYRSAQYVIVAHGSDNMHSGMSGISRPRPQTQMRVQFAGLVLTSDAFDDFCDRDYKGCGYLERGWTYQEFELARRKICFRNTQAFLECRHGRKEEYHHGFGDNGDEGQTVRRVAPLFSQYTSHIEAYSLRRLTFYSDAIAAITGVLHWLYEGKCDILCGLPTPHFDRALLWYYESGELDRPPNSEFPSWSWAYHLGTCGKIVFHDATWHGLRLAYEFCGTLVPWYVVNADYSVRPVNNVADDQLCAKWETYAAIAYEGGCVANITYPPEGHATKPTRYWKDYDSYIRQIVPLSFRTDDQQRLQLISSNAVILQKEILLTRAQTATLAWKLSPSDIHWGIQLLSPDGHKIGEVALPLKDRNRYGQLPAQWGKTVEVMGISLAIMTAPALDATLPPDKFVNREGQGFPDVPVVNILVIERNGRLVQRKQLGWVYLGDWIKLGKEWGYIILA